MDMDWYFLLYDVLCWCCCHSRCSSCFAIPWWFSMIMVIYSFWCGFGGIQNGDSIWWSMVMDVILVVCTYKTSYFDVGVGGGAPILTGTGKAPASANAFQLRITLLSLDSFSIFTNLNWDRQGTSFGQCLSAQNHTFSSWIFTGCSDMIYFLLDPLLCCWDMVLALGAASASCSTTAVHSLLTEEVLLNSTRRHRRWNQQVNDRFAVEPLCTM